MGCGKTIYYYGSWLRNPNNKYSDGTANRGQRVSRPPSHPPDHPKPKRSSRTTDSGGKDGRKAAGSCVLYCCCTAYTARTRMMVEKTSDIFFFFFETQLRTYRKLYTVGGCFALSFSPSPHLSTISSFYCFADCKWSLRPRSSAAQWQWRPCIIYIDSTH